MGLAQDSLHSRSRVRDRATKAIRESERRGKGATGLEAVPRVRTRAGSAQIRNAEEDQRRLVGPADRASYLLKQAWLISFRALGVATGLRQPDASEPWGIVP